MTNECTQIFLYDYFQFLWYTIVRLKEREVKEMFVHYEKNQNMLPIKIWQTDMEAVGTKCIEQAEHLAKLPFAFGHAALMPDTHVGKGMPIGGVIACENVVIPNAVGVDIGCGMAYIQTDIPVSLLRETITGSGTLLQTICGDILRNIPTGFGHHKKPQPSEVLDRAKAEAEKYERDKELLMYGLWQVYWQARGIPHPFS